MIESAIASHRLISPIYVGGEFSRGDNRSKMARYIDGRWEKMPPSKWEASAELPESPQVSLLQEALK